MYRAVLIVAFLGITITGTKSLECNGSNEEKRCVAECPPERTCRNKGIMFNCQTNSTENCEDKCVCKDGFSRNAIGECISNDDCDKCLGKNEYFSCGGACDNVCADLETQSQDNCPIRNIKCNEMCYCEEGYARDENNVCVPFDQCNQPCGENEYKDYCPANCPSDYCPKKQMKSVSCPQPNPCPEPKCKCRFNYRRADNGTCIPTTSCPPFKCYKPNEVYNPCPPICPNGQCGQATPDGTCPSRFGRIGLVLTCNPACRCKEDYWYDNEVCVPYAQCPGKGGVKSASDNALECNRKNEESRCVFECPPETTCRTQGRVYKCARKEDEVCTDKCVCKDNYYRNTIGDCISKNECDMCTGDNEYFSCGPECDNVCETLQTQNQTNCPIVNIVCNRKCYCDPGYARNDNGICVPFDKCENN